MTPEQRTTLGELIDATPWADTHEHIVEEHRRLRPGPYEVKPEEGDPMAIAGDWSLLIDAYAMADLVVAGLSPQLARELPVAERSPLEKWDALAPSFEAARNTGHVRAVELTTERLFGLPLSRETVEELDVRVRALRVEGYYERVLREVANVSWCHVHSVEDDPFCETRQPHLLGQDISLDALARGHHAPAERASGIEAGSLDDYLRMLEWCFERYAAHAVGAKCAWAYYRPLAMDVPQAPPRRAFERLRAGTAELAEERRVQDFLLQRCVELATDAGLPVKLHLGLLGGTCLPHFRHVFDHVRDIVPLVQANPSTTFVLYHIAWPQQEQLLALAKHQPNVVLDLCWAWTMTPHGTQELLERALTTLPASKLLCFGADGLAVEHVVGHAEIARRGLQAALEGLVGRGWFTPADAAALVPRLMHGNAERIFPRPGGLGEGRTRHAAGALGVPAGR